MLKKALILIALILCMILKAQISPTVLKKQEIYKELSAKSSSEVMLYLQKAAKIQNDLWDIDVLVSLNVLSSRPEAVPLLGETISDSVKYSRVSRLLITETLGSIGNPAALPYLKKAAKMDDRVIADKAISALGEIKDSEDNELLEQLRNADDKEEKNKILRAMMNVKYMDSRKKQIALYQELAKIAYNPEEDIELRSPAFACLGLFGRNTGISDKFENEKFIRLCLDIVKNENETKRLRIACLEALERSRAISAIDELYELILTTNDLQLTFAIIRDFYMLCSKKADLKLEELRKLTNDKEWLINKQQSVLDYYNSTKNKDLKEKFINSYHFHKSPQGLNDIKPMFDNAIPPTEFFQKNDRGVKTGRSMIE